ncbi:hypothetical protein CASFOL_035847 [Castilleja foliolosa]|uniref:HMA domain-containing protein n=1 Tax=Castilleja foliolosa TaxID=1961234 RepID=A0ABD3BW58_9LAMI
MESTLLSVGASTTMSFLSISKSLNSHSAPIIVQLHRRLSTLRHCQLAQLNPSRCAESSKFGPGSLVRGLVSPNLPRNRLQFAARSAASFSAGGGGFGGIDNGAGGGGGGGDGAAEGGDAKPSAVAHGAADGSASSSEVIILDVGGMTCGGCAASVKRILESQPHVSSASVNLTTETAVVWPVSEAKVAPNWQKDVGEALAKHLTNCGFNSNLRDQGAIDGDIQF